MTISGSVAAFETHRPLRLKVAPMAGPTLRPEIRINIRHAQAEHFLTGIPQNAAAFLIDVVKTPPVIDQKGSFAYFVQGETEEGDFLLSPLACGPGTQGDDAERQVCSQFLEEPDFFRGKGVGLCGINAKTAEDLCVFVFERQDDARTIAAL
jgi:hypothetical protein